ncbi:MAG: hypothetical protein HY662_01005, partial [Chloroflexi bacterium]|nr:hypothetical protein [Chloroflexota bacterium]
MAEDLEQKEMLAEENPAGGSDPGQGAALESAGLGEDKDDVLTPANIRLKELEQSLVSKDNEIETLRQAKEELEARVTTISSSLAEAIASYRTRVVAANPE